MPRDIAFGNAGRRVDSHLTSYASASVRNNQIQAAAYSAFLRARRGILAYIELVKAKASVRRPRALAPDPIPGSLENGHLAELLALEAEKATGHLRRALNRAARAAFLWPVEAAELVRSGEPLIQLPAIGPHLQRLLRQWIEQPPDVLQPPPIRRHFLTLAHARRILATRPEWAAQYRGDLQMHSTWSDGAGDISAMAKAALERGYEYIGITDHSKGLKIAGGIDEPDLRNQAAEIEHINSQFRHQRKAFRVLCSIELNLSPSGDGDMDPKALAALDLVVGSFHSALRKKEDQTERYLAALQNPTVHILGHPRGRVYNFRLGLSAEWPRVFDMAARLDKAVELDSYSDRQDLDLELLLLAKESGVRIAIDTDAHAPEQLAFVELGLAAALLAGIKPDRIINFLPVDELLSWAARDAH